MGAEPSLPRRSRPLVTANSQVRRLAAEFGFFTTSTWFISTNQFGIAAILPLGILAALFALVIAVPVGIATAVFISEYAPPTPRTPAR